MNLEYEQIRSVLRTVVQQVWVAAGKPTDIEEFRSFLEGIGATDEQIVGVLNKRGFEAERKPVEKNAPPREIPGTTLGANTPIKQDTSGFKGKVEKMAQRMSEKQLQRLINML